MEPDQEPVEPPPETILDRMLTLGTWVVAVIAVIVAVALVVFLVRWGLGHEDVGFFGLVG